MYSSVEVFLVNGDVLDFEEVEISEFDGFLSVLENGPAATHINLSEVRYYRMERAV